MKLPHVHPNLNALLTFSRNRLWMSYEELNTSIPDEMVHPDQDRPAARASSSTLSGSN